MNQANTFTPIQILAQQLIRRLGWFAVSVLFMLTVLVPAASADTLEGLGAPQLFLRGESGELTPALLTDTHLALTVKGSSVRGTLTQSFTNQSDVWANGVYAMPLPEHAAVHGWEMNVAGRRIVGLVRERQEAKKRFERAKSEGRRAGLLEVIDPGLFQIRLANIDPQSTITVSIDLTFTADIDGRRFALRFPTTVTPRYEMTNTARGNAASHPSTHGSRNPSAETHSAEIPSAGTPSRRTLDTTSVSARIDMWAAQWIDSWEDSSASNLGASNLGASNVGAAGSSSSSSIASSSPGAAVHQVPLLPRIHHPFSYDIDLEPGANLVALTTPLHDSQFADTRRGFRVTSAGNRAELDRDFILRWELAPSNEPEATLVVEENDGQWFANLEIIEPSDPLAMRPPPQEIVLILDISGSMAGDALRQAKAAARQALSLLKPADRFNLIAFDHEVHLLFDQPRYAYADSIAAGIAFIDDLEAQGGTEIELALDAGLMQVGASTHERPQLVFVTDGAVWAEGSLYRKIASQLGDARLSTVAIGAAPNGAFMRQAAVLGRGMYRQIARTNDVSGTLSALMTALSRPLLTDITIDWPVDTEPASPVMADLYHGQPVRSLVRFEEPPGAQIVTVRGLLGGWPWQSDVRLTLPRTTGDSRGRGGVSSRWAQQRVQWLLDQAVLAGQPESSVRDAVLALGLAHNLVTPFTSLIAEEMRRARPPAANAGEFMVPPQVPAKDFEFPQTATAASLWLYFGLLTLFLGVLVVALSRDDSPVRAVLLQELPND